MLLPAMLGTQISKAKNRVRWRKEARCPSTQNDWGAYGEHEVIRIKSLPTIASVRIPSNAIAHLKMYRKSR